MSFCLKHKIIIFDCILTCQNLLTVVSLTHAFYKQIYVYIILLLTDFVSKRLLTLLGFMLCKQM
jgi:hypothetical protein